MGSIHGKGRDNTCNRETCGIEPSNMPSQAPLDKVSQSPSDKASQAQEFVVAQGSGRCADKNNEGLQYEDVSPKVWDPIPNEVVCLEKCQEEKKAGTSVSGCGFIVSFDGATCSAFYHESFVVENIITKHAGDDDYCWVFN